MAVEIDSSEPSRAPSSVTFYRRKVRNALSLYSLNRFTVLNDDISLWK